MTFEPHSRIRPRRSLLLVSPLKPDALAPALRSSADVVCIDLEDAYCAGKASAGREADTTRVDVVGQVVDERPVLVEEDRGRHRVVPALPVGMRACPLDSRADRAASARLDRPTPAHDPA